MGELLLTAVIVLVLVLANGLFVAAEFSIVGVPRVAIERRAASGDRVARTVLGILRDNRRRDRFIATAQLGITVASLGLGMYGEHKLAEAIGGGLHAAGVGDWRWLPAHTLASILAVVILTYLHIVLGEMIPKSIALQQAEGTVLWVTPVLLVVQRVSIVLIIILSYLGNALLRLFGIDRATSQPEQVR
ncbi:MAG TPA: CNNM domain-containing protein, partial [Longimicrobium sp.]